MSNSTGVNTRIVLSGGMGYAGARTGVDDGGAGCMGDGWDGSVVAEVTGWAGACLTAALSVMELGERVIVDRGYQRSRRHAAPSSACSLVGVSISSTAHPPTGAARAPLPAARAHPAGRRSCTEAGSG